jgi:hypothetical protein
MEGALTRYRLLLACLPVVALVGLAVAVRPSSPAPESDAESRLLDMLRDSGTIRHPDLPFTLSARAVRGCRLYDVVLKQHNAQGEFDLVICARQGELVVAADERQLYVHLLDGHGLTADGSRTRFAERTWELPLPGELVSRGAP